MLHRFFLGIIAVALLATTAHTQTSQYDPVRPSYLPGQYPHASPTDVTLVPTTDDRFITLAEFVQYYDPNNSHITLAQFLDKVSADIDSLEQRPQNTGNANVSVVGSLPTPTADSAEIVFIPSTNRLYIKTGSLGSYAYTEVEGDAPPSYTQPATWAQENNSDDIPENKIPATIARDSELTGFLNESQVDGRIATYARISPTGQIAEAQIPATIARTNQIPSVPTPRTDAQVRTLASNAVLNTTPDAPTQSVASDYVLWLAEDDDQIWFNTRAANNNWLLLENLTTAEVNTLITTALGSYSSTTQVNDAIATAVTPFLNREQILQLIRANGGSAGAGRLGPYTDKLIQIAEGVAFQSSDTFTTRVDTNEAIGAYYSWRGDEAAYSLTNTDGVLESDGTGQLATNRVSGSNLVVGLGHLQYLKGHWYSPTANNHTIYGRSPSGVSGNLDEIPLIRTNNGNIQVNITGIRGASTGDQNWITLTRGDTGGLARYTQGQPLDIVFEVNFGTGHLDPDDSDSVNGPYHEFVLGYHAGDTYVQTNNIRASTASNGRTNLSNPTSDFDGEHNVDFWDSDVYSTHAQLEQLLRFAQTNRNDDEKNRLLGKLFIDKHHADRTVIDLRPDGATGGQQIVDLVDADGDPFTGERGPRGYAAVRAITLVAHNAAVPSAPTLTDANFNFTTHTWTGVTGGTGWGFSLSNSYSADDNDVYAVTIFVDEDGDALATQTLEPHKIDGENLPDSTGGSGLTQDEVDARISPWARIVPTTFIPRTRIPQASTGGQGAVELASSTELAAADTNSRVPSVRGTTTMINARIDDTALAGTADTGSTTNAPSIQAVNDALAGKAGTADLPDSDELVPDFTSANDGDVLTYDDAGSTAVWQAPSGGGGGGGSDTAGTVEDLPLVVSPQRTRLDISFPSGRTLNSYSSIQVRFSYTSAGSQGSLAENLMVVIPITLVAGTTYTTINDTIPVGSVINLSLNSYSIPLEHRGANAVYMTPVNTSHTSTVSNADNFLNLSIIEQNQNVRTVYGFDSSPAVSHKAVGIRK